jgi:DNA-binding NtrC family response regulator
MVSNNTNPGAGLKALIVDDSSAVLTYLSQLLCFWGYETITATCRKEALAALEDGAKLPALAIVDVVLGSENGLQLATQLQERAAHMQVLLISGYADNFIDLDLGAPHQKRTFFLAKTFSPSQLKDALATMAAAKLAE